MTPRLYWYRRDPLQSLLDMADLTLEERGAYATVLDLIYSQADMLKDDERSIAGWMRCDVRVWRRLRTRLLDAGKLHVEDGFLRNIDATSETLRGVGRVLSAAEAGRKSAATRKENNDLASTTDEQIRSRSRSRIPPLVPPKGERRKTRLPDDFAMPAEWLEAARARRPDVDPVPEAERWKAHHLARGDPMMNWRQAWTTWYCSGYYGANRAANGRGGVRSGNGRVMAYEPGRDDAVFARAAARVIAERMDAGTSAQSAGIASRPGNGAAVGGNGAHLAGSDSHLPLADPGLGGEAGAAGARVGNAAQAGRTGAGDRGGASRPPKGANGSAHPAANAQDRPGRVR